MRLLITLLTVLTSAFAACCTSGARAAADLPCLPTEHDTAWIWPLAGPASSAPPDLPALPDLNAPPGQHAPPDLHAPPGQLQPPGQHEPPDRPEPPDQQAPPDRHPPPDRHELPSSPAVRAGPAILRAFDPPAHRWGAGHRGVDLAGGVAEPVRAAGPGVVLYAGRVVNRGVVVIGHGVLRTSYEPVDAVLPVGATVAVGEQVGTLDAGHCRSGACLHWGLLSGHGHAITYYDPLLLLGCGQIRLEPVIAAPRSR